VYDPFDSGTQTGICCVFLSMCVFSIPRVFYHCPTTSVAPRLKNTCRPGRKFFFFFYQHRPCVDHAAVRATPDCVHRVTVLCCATLLVLCHIARAVPLCPTVSYSAVLIPCCATMLCRSTAVCSVSSVLCRSVPPSRRRGLVMLLPPRF